MNVDWFPHFAYFPALYVTLPIVLMATGIVFWWRSGVRYAYSLGATLYREGYASSHPYKKILHLIRFCILGLLAFLIAKPQLVDHRSEVSIEGIDIMLVLDASGSMQQGYDDDDGPSRFDVAKREALRFIQKRDNDALGLVIFGKEAISRCPLTSDKNILVDLITDLQLGDVDPNGTVIGRSMISAANRLRRSKAKSKIMILLTDGTPNSELDIDIDYALSVVKKMGIKVYTVGIGQEGDKPLIHPLFRVSLGVVPGVNRELLKKISSQTGGQFFFAKDASDMRKIYETIDQLETTVYTTPIFTDYKDIFEPFVCAVLALCVLQVFLSTFIWFGL